MYTYKYERCLAIMRRKKEHTMTAAICVVEYTSRKNSV